MNYTSRVDEDGYYVVSGEVLSSGMGKAFSISVLCTFYDSEGNVIAVSRAYVASEMDSGERKIFEVSSKPHRIKPASYSLPVVAHHYELIPIARYRAPSHFSRCLRRLHSFHEA